MVLCYKRKLILGQPLPTRQNFSALWLRNWSYDCSTSSYFWETIKGTQFMLVATLSLFWCSVFHNSLPGLVFTLCSSLILCQYLLRMPPTVCLPHTICHILHHSSVRLDQILLHTIIFPFDVILEFHIFHKFILRCWFLFELSLIFYIPNNSKAVYIIKWW